MAPNILKMWKQVSPYPLGKHVASLAFGLYAPYFLNLRALITDMQIGHAEVVMKQRWAVQNHIKTVHAIAVCNLIEMTMGIVATTTIPKHLRWLPKGMDVNYLKKSSGTLTCTSTVDPKTIFTLPAYPGDVSIPVEVRNANGDLVTSATVRLWISENKPK